MRYHEALESAEEAVTSRSKTKLLSSVRSAESDEGFTFTVMRMI